MAIGAALTTSAGKTKTSRAAAIAESGESAAAAAAGNGERRPSTKATRPPAESTQAASTKAALSADENYPGGKGAVFRWIVDKLPTHWRYVELCVGKGAVMRHKPPALRSTLIDSDDEVLAWWRRLDWPGVELVHGCGRAWLAAHLADLDGDCLIYADPPYPLDTRTKRRLYKHEWRQRDHKQLLSLLRCAGCAAAVSSYDNPLYNQMLRDWRRHETQAMTRGGTMRTEVLWTNYDPLEAASPIRPFIGDGFRERERIGRKVERARSRVWRNTPAENKAVALAMLEAMRRQQNGGARSRQGRLW